MPATTKIPAPALATRAIMAAVPADTDTLPLLPRGHTGTQCSDDTRHFMSWNAGILHAGPGAFFRERVTMAHATGLHLDPHVSCTRRGHLVLDDLKICSWLRNLRHLHWCNGDSCRCHTSSYACTPMVEQGVLLLAS
jgi:hypothetical protein